MMRSLIIVFLVSLLFSTARADVFSYEELNIPSVVAIERTYEFDNGSLLISNGSNAYMSADEGSSWRNVTQGNGNTLWGFSARRDGVIYLSNTCLVIRSTDYGNTWHEIQTKEKPYKEKQFILQDGRLAHIIQNKLFVTKSSLENCEVQILPCKCPIACGIANDGRIFVIDSAMNFYTCPSYGAEWKFVTRIDTIEESELFHIAIGPNDEIAFDHGNRLICSRDFGQTWEAVTGFGVAYFAFRPDGSLEVLRYKDSTLLSYSRSGTEWKQLDTLALPYRTSLFMRTHAGVLIIFTPDDEIMRSTDNGNSWVFVSEGVPKIQPNEISPVSGGGAFFTSRYRNGNFGFTIDNNGKFSSVPLEKYASVVPVNLSPDTLFMKNGDVASCSRDHGKSWTVIANNFGDGFYPLTVNDLNGRFYGINGNVIISTQDGGRTWAIDSTAPVSIIWSATILDDGRLAFCNDSTGISTYDPQTKVYGRINSEFRKIDLMAYAGNGIFLVYSNARVYHFNSITETAKEVYNAKFVSVDGLQCVGNKCYIFTNRSSYYSTDQGISWKFLPVPNCNRQKLAIASPSGSVYSSGSFGFFRLDAHEGNFDINSISPDSLQWIGNEITVDYTYKGIPGTPKASFFFYGGMFRDVKSPATVSSNVATNKPDGSVSGIAKASFDRHKELLVLNQAFPLFVLESDKKYISSIDKRFLFLRSRDIISESHACLGQVFKANCCDLLFVELPLCWVLDSTANLYTFNSSPMARICYLDTGYHNIKLISYSDSCKLYADTVVQTIYVHNLPEKPTLSKINDVTLLSSEGYKYQWYLNTIPIPGANSRIYSDSAILGGGFYTVTIEDTLGCISMNSNEYYNPVAEPLPGGNGLVAYPNPVADVLYVVPPQGLPSMTVKISNGVGEIVRQETFSTSPSTIPVQVGDLPAGAYFVRIESSSGIRTAPFVVSR